MEASYLRIDVVYEEETAYIKLGGELDYASAPTLLEVLNTVVSRGSQSVVFDLHELDFVDSEGIKTILRAHNWIAKINGNISIVGCSEHTAKVLDMAGVSLLIPVESRKCAVCD